MTATREAGEAAHSSLLRRESACRAISQYRLLYGNNWACSLKHIQQPHRYGWLHRMVRTRPRPAGSVFSDRGDISGFRLNMSPKAPDMRSSVPDGSGIIPCRNELYAISPPPHPSLFESMQGVPPAPPTAEKSLAIFSLQPSQERHTGTPRPSGLFRWTRPAGRHQACGTIITGPPGLKVRDPVVSHGGEAHGVGVLSHLHGGDPGAFRRGEPG